MRYLHEIASQGDTAVIMATHNLGLVDQFPGRLLRCENKRIVADAEPVETDGQDSGSDSVPEKDAEADMPETGNNETTKD